MAIKGFTDRIIYLPDSFIKEAEKNGTTEETVYSLRNKYYWEKIYRGEVKDLLVFSRLAVENTLIEEDHVVISITDPEKPQALLPSNPYRKGVLRLKFYDTNDEIGCISWDDIRDLRTFLKNTENVKLIVTHCEAGISRSSGMAAALSKFYNGDDKYFFKYFVPNTRVYSRVLNQLI